MGKVHIQADLRRLVAVRARNCCEYCLLDSQAPDVSHEIDHYIAVIHGGKTEGDNLVLACLKCNRHKGTNLVAIDPLEGGLEPVFNPRLQRWNDHFEVVGAQIVGLTPTGRATVDLLKMNDDIRVELRRGLVEAGLFPPL